MNSGENFFFTATSAMPCNFCVRSSRVLLTVADVKPKSGLISRIISFAPRLLVRKTRLFSKFTTELSPNRKMPRSSTPSNKRVNDGAAFSLFADTASPHLVRWVLIGFSLLAAVVVLIAMVRLGDRFTLTTIALALVFAGALGNVHDRILYGSVVDFIEVHIFAYHFPDFNVADSSVVTGACLLLLDSLLPQRKQAN